MKIEALTENIEKALPILGRIIPSHSQIPVLSNVLIEAVKEGVFLYATNLETGVRIRIPAKIEEEGSTTVSGKHFIEALSSLPRDKATMSIEEENLIIRCRNNKVVFQTISKTEFPNILEQKGEKVRLFREGEIKKVFEKIVFAVSMDETRPELTGVLISQKNGEEDIVSTDGFRLSLTRRKKERTLPEEFSLIVPARIISEAMTFTGDAIMYVYKKGNQVVFESGDVLLVGRIINGEFPNYEKVIPQSSKTSVVLDREEFLQKLRLSSVFAKDAANIIKIIVEEGRVRMRARASGIGEEEAMMEAEQKGEDNEIAFNIKFLMDLIKAVSEKNIIMELSSPVEPACFRTPEDPNFLHIIMPVRVQE